jgi:hypothetical protein
LDDLAAILEHHAKGGLNLGTTDLPAPAGVNRSQVIEAAISFAVASLKPGPPPTRPPTGREIVDYHVEHVERHSETSHDSS